MKEDFHLKELMLKGQVKIIHLQRSLCSGMIHFILI